MIVPSFSGKKYETTVNTEWMITLKTSMTPQMKKSGKMISNMIRKTTRNTIINMNITMLI